MPRSRPFSPAWLPSPANPANGGGRATVRTAHLWEPGSAPESRRWSPSSPCPEAACHPLRHHQGQQTVAHA
jgi:hypothetical protein